MGWEHISIDLFNSFQDVVLRLIDVETKLYSLKSRCVNFAAIDALSENKPQSSRIVLQQANEFSVVCDNPNKKSLLELADSMAKEHSNYELLSQPSQISRRLLSQVSAATSSLSQASCVAILAFVLALSL